ncbi:VIT family protein [Kitasatospora sp. NPDC057692]|uniref:VIT1/CCC1 transporter family protein n=1 Tax=Kitasatospora sp. NPDC057692 TaxID=3346215 RepID=UPI0036813048
MGPGDDDREPHSAAAGPHAGEPHEAGGLSGRLNWLRAGVLGANDGVVSTAGLVVGVAGARATAEELLTAGLAGLLAGSLSMAAGEYVSVSTQRDSERAALATERRELATEPQAELDELTDLYIGKGLSPHLARQVATELTAHDPLAAHAEAELGINPKELVNPWNAAAASLAAFTVGALLPLLAIVLPPADARVPITVTAVLLALAACGWGSARLGAAPVRPAVLRNVAGGALAMAVTYAAGALLHASTR